jgi:TonB family protein
MNLKRFAISLGLILTLTAPVFIHASQLEDELSSELNNKIVIFRSFPIDNRVVFDSSGNQVGGKGRGYWSAHSMVEIHDVSIHRGDLRLKGLRILNLFDDKTGTFKNERTKQTFEARIQLDRSWRDANAVRPLLDEVLLRDPKQMGTIVPEYWKDCFVDMLQTKTGFVCGQRNIPPQRADQAKSAPGGPPDSAEKPVAVSDASSASTSAEASAQTPQELASKYSIVGHGVTAPKARFTPDPEYPEVARQQKLQGRTILWLVVNKQGEPEHIRIYEPVGGGLDDRAVEAVQRWKFFPAMHDGQPVAVQINVEVNFRLY